MNSMTLEQTERDPRDESPFFYFLTNPSMSITQQQESTNSYLLHKEVRAIKALPESKTKLSDLIQTEIYQINKKALQSPESLTQQEKQLITHKINNSCNTSYNKASIITNGWMFDFSNVIHRFVVRYNDTVYQVVFGCDIPSVVDYFTNTLDIKIDAIQRINI